MLLTHSHDYREHHVVLLHTVLHRLAQTRGLTAASSTNLEHRLLVKGRLFFWPTHNRCVDLEEGSAKLSSSPVAFEVFHVSSDSAPTCVAPSASSGLEIEMLKRQTR